MGERDRTRAPKVGLVFRALNELGILLQAGSDAELKTAEPSAELIDIDAIVDRRRSRVPPGQGRERDKP